MYENVKDFNVKIISHFGHLSYSMTCPICLELFEEHNDQYLDILKCPYCKTDYEVSKLDVHEISA
jgi:phage FluMu protein Com